MQRERCKRAVFFKLEIVIVFAYLSTSFAFDLTVSLLLAFLFLPAFSALERLP